MTDSCQIDFYVLKKPGLDARQMACRLAMMSWERGHRTLLVTDSRKTAEQMDELLWELPPGRFLPHEIDADKATAPVRITLLDRLSDTSGKADGLNGFEVLINLCSQPVPDPERFDRLLEIVPQEQKARKASRTKFKYYREQGITPGSHEISK